jgi:hypothetical protein
MSEDAIAKFKEAQRQGWKRFAPLEALTTPGGGAFGEVRERSGPLLPQHPSLLPRQRVRDS